MIRFWSVAAGLLISVVVQAEDEVTVYRDEGGRTQTLRGTITEESKAQVVLKTQTKDETIPLNRISAIRYDQQPAELINVRVKMNQGRFDDAIKDLTEIGQALPKDKLFLQGYVFFNIFDARARMAIGDPTKFDEAKAAYDKIMSVMPDSRHYYPMQELLGRMSLAKGDYDSATKAFRDLGSAPHPGSKQRAQVYEGVASLRQKQYPAAIALFDQVIAAAGMEAEVMKQKHLAQVYKGEALAASGKPADAEKLLRPALEAIPAEEIEVKAIGHNALGDALLALAQGKPAAEAGASAKLAAIDGYLWVAVLYNGAPEQTAKALYQLSIIFAQIGRAEDSQKMATQLRTEFPNSEWTKKLAG